MAKKTKTPTGLTITRNNNVFTLTWKLGEKYAKGQAVQYRTNLLGWTALSVGATATSRAVGLTTSAFYPTTARSLQWIEMRVRGAAKKKTVSDWSVIRFTLQVPRIPTLTATMDDQLSNVCVFAWTTVTAASDAYWFINTEYQSMLVKESNITDGSQLVWNETQQGWQSGTSTVANSVTVTEDTSAIADGSYTRWFRVRARGPRGASGWKYAKHVYGLSYQANIISAVATVQPAGGFQCRVEWEAPASASHPIDRTTVEYTITAPEEGLTCPDSATWTPARVSADTENADAAVFPIDRLLAANQCLFVRVNTQHDNVVTYGLPVLAEGGVGVLSDPTLTSVVLGDNYMVTINATNNSPVEDSFLVILYRPSSDPAREIVIGTIPHGSTTANVQAPDWSGEEAFAFGVYAAVGNAVGITHDSALMASSIVWGQGDVPKAPANVSVSATNISGTIRVEWDWTWTNATGAELSWSDHEDAWESTDQPDTYEISSIHNSRWHISGLETGIKWYVKVRLKKGTGDNETFGPYSETAIIDLTSAPSIPTLVLSESVITETGSVTASWVYTTTDGTAQTYAEICEAEITTEGIEYGDVIAHTETAQHVTISAEELGWQSGNTYNLCVRVVSASGRVSDEWSAPVSVMVAEPLTIEITETSLVEDSETITVDGTTVTRYFNSLTEMPLELTVEGAGDNGNVNVVIERATSYYVDRPDETDFTGYEGETIAVYSQTGDGEIIISDLIGTLDDGASYRLIAMVQDNLGQSAQTEIEFEVHWSHQAVVPEGTVIVEEEDLIAKITPIAPTGALLTDVCDIYRLSADRPELVVKGAQFGTTYVDPYMTIGQFGGYRLVFRTANGDYITAENEIAWLDLIDKTLEIDYTVIDFDGGRIMLHYNVDVSSSWTKDFQETKYLGGSVQGDWNPAVSRTSSISAVSITITDEDQMEMIRRLAVSPTICHVRTKDGSSYAADVQVSEDHPHDKRGKVASYTFSITRVDTEELDGMTLAQWNEINIEE